MTIRNVFELEPGAPGRAPYCPSTGYNGCTVAATADCIEGYGGGPVADLVALGQLMGAKCRAFDHCSHGICPKAWCAKCGHLELRARGLPFAYGLLTWPEILAELAAGHWVMTPGLYGKIRYVPSSSYSDLVPAGGRSDTFVGPHMMVLTHSTGGHIATLDPDFGNQRGTPPYSLLVASDVRAFWGALSAPVVYATQPPDVSMGPNVPSVHYAYGGAARLRGRGTYVGIAKPYANVRSSPYLRTDNLVGRLAPGATFSCAQSTVSGSRTAGSSVWRGDASGRRWVHASVVRPR